MRNQRLNTKVISYKYPTGVISKLVDSEGYFTGEIASEYSDDINIRVVIIKGKGKIFKEFNGVMRAFDATVLHMGSQKIPSESIITYNGDTYTIESVEEMVNSIKYYLTYKHIG